MSKELLDRLGEPFPQSALKQRVAGGGRNFTYVEGHTVIHRLNACLPEGWSFRVLSTDIKPWGQTSRGAAQAIVLATVELDIPGLGTRSHVGVQVVSEGAGEDLFKGAVTDGLKKAATLFGVGLELYGPDYEGVDQVTGEIRPSPAGVARPAPQQRAPVQPANGQQRPTAGPGLASASQIKYLHDLAREGNQDPDVTPHDFLRGQQYARFRVEHTNELTKAQASQLIDWLAKKDLVTAEYPPAPGDPVEAAQRGFDGMPEEPPWVRDADAYTR